VFVDFSSADTPHLLIAGQTGSGKSVVLEALLRGLCQWKTADELKLVLVDGKGTELVEFEDSPHLRGEIGWLPEDAIAALDASVEEMNRRYELFKTHRVRSLQQYNELPDSDARIPWHLVVLDEYADLTSDPDERKQIEIGLKRVAQKGRAAGIHLIVATQKPSAEVLSTVVRSNLPAQLALRVKSSTDSRIILDEAGAESLAGKGDAFLKTAKGMTRVQCSILPPQNPTL
jgi:DNA phosphorothioation-dependent restriction protein DptH